MATALITNNDAADLLFNVATILELAEDNPYRVRAYRRAARLLLRFREDARVRLTADNELDLPGLGSSLRRKLGELLATGRMGFYVELCADLPPDVARLMLIPGVGPKIALRLHEELGLTGAADVYAAAQSRKIRQLYGFGERRERLLLDGASDVLAGRPKIYAVPPLDDEDDPIPPRPIEIAPGQLRLPEAA